MIKLQSILKKCPYRRKNEEFKSGNPVRQGKFPLKNCCNAKRYSHDVRESAK